MITMMGWGFAEQQGWRKGPWTPEEDKLLSEYVNLHGEGRWSCVAKCAGLNRSGKSCRLRWVNYLRPGLKRGHITPQEEGIIIELHALWGNKWSTIARYLPGRTDNEIKNFWRTHFKKKEKCTQKQEKRKAQILLAKQQQQQEQQQQQQQLQEDQNLKIRATPQSEASQGENINMTTDHEAQARQENNMDLISSSYPNLEGDQYCLPALMNQGSVGSWADILGEEGLYMGRLWNLDDEHVNGRMDRNTSLSQCNKSAMQNQAAVTAFSSGGDYPNTFYNGGYIF
ncbi:unnamed protein product [Prunus armeniaca]|uniref:MYB transcription factor n=1 Tax=Prunus armeniaca TaxID=36596 RepID=A0A6J5WYZ2_PRUAR|nr:unnamed protein product [Prunus armeniaca]